MSGIEWIATIFGVLCVALAAARSIWTFPTALVSVTLVGVVVFEARLYSDALLQAFFVLANIYGWRNWSRSTARAGEIVVGWMTRVERWQWGLGILAASLAWGSAMHALTDASYPWWDAGIAGTSIAAQILMARRRIENWLLWIAVDVASVPLYAAKGLYLLAGLYMLYLALSLGGLAGWLRAMRLPVRGQATAA